MQGLVGNLEVRRLLWCQGELCLACILNNVKINELLDEQNCEKQELLMEEESGAVFDIFLMIVIITILLLIITVIVCVVKRYKNQNRSYHSVSLARLRTHPPVSSDLPPSCPPQPPILPPPYTMVNPSHFIEQDAAKPLLCDLILQSSD